MKHLKIGAGILSFWFLFNIIPGILSLILIGVGKHAPAFQYLFNQNEINSLDMRILQTTDGVAIIANALIVSYCFISFFLVRKCLVKRERWSLWVLAFGILVIQIASYWSDQQFLGKNFWIVNFSSLLFLLGLSLSFSGIYRAQRRPRPLGRSNL